MKTRIFTLLVLTISCVCFSYAQNTSSEIKSVANATSTDTLSCATARELAIAGNTSNVIVKGYVTSIAVEWNSTYKNISFWLADGQNGSNVFQAYRVACANESDAPSVGDLVWVKGNLYYYNNTTPEISSGGSFGIIQKLGHILLNGLYYNLNVSKKTAEVTYKSYSSTGGTYNTDWNISTANIPSSITSNRITYRVTTIGDYAFYGCSSLTSVTIPNSVTSVGNSAFTGCSSLPVTDNIRYADKYLVQVVDKSLSSYTIKNGTKWIGTDAFASCSSLTSVTIPSSVTSIGYEAFAGCTGLSSITIPNSVTTIGSHAFSGCKGLTSVTIPNSVTNIGLMAFSYCTSLTSVTIPNSVSSIGYDAFTLVNNIVYSGSATGAPWGAKSINGYVEGYLIYRDNSKTELLGCSSVATGEITVPNSVTSIGNTVFYGCKGLTSVSIPNSVTTIGNQAFSHCTGLTSIDIPNSVTSIGNSIFDGCAGLTSVNIPNSVTTIGSYAFNGCTGLISVTIPNSVTFIGIGVFFGCKGLTSVTIPNSVLSIGKYAFRDCTALTSVTIGDSVTSIGEEAFSRCFGLTSVAIPNSVTNIENRAFQNAGLTSVTIGNSVTSIGIEAFICTKLSIIKIDAIVPPALGRDAFYENSSKSIYVPCGSLDAYKSKSSWSSYISIIKYEPLNYSIVIETPENGTVTVPQNICDSLIATPDNGYHFVQWSDGNTENPRYIDLSQDTTFAVEFGINKYNVDVTCDDQYGMIVGESGIYDYHSQIVYEAVPHYGYHFEKWSDGNKENPRSILVNYDLSITAVFAKNKYSLYSPYTQEQGTVSGAGEYLYLDTISLAANANYGYHFVQWNDGNTDNPRTIVLTQDTTFTAEFAIDKSGTCGENMTLNWAFEDSTKTLTISGSGALTENYTYGVEAPTQMEHLVIGNDVTAIGDSAFYGRTTIAQVTIGGNVTAIGNYAFADIDNRQLTSIVMPAELTTIGDYAFSGNTYLESIDFNAKLLSIGAYAFKDCRRVSEMTCMAETTPDVGTNALSSINSYASLCVPASCVRKYQVDPNWGRFDLCELGATTSTGSVTTVIVEPSDNTALFTWPTENDAATYTLQITKDGEVFCTLVFNANGQLTGIAFAPSRTGTPHAPAATLSNGAMQFTVTGLNIANKYAYRLAVTDASNVELQSYSGEFATNGYEEEVNPGGETGTTRTDQLYQDPASNVQKLLRDGQILILRGDRTYTVTAQELR